MNNDSDNIFGPVISRYTRQQAIEDGILVDCEQGDLKGMAKEAGLDWPVAMTTAAFEAAVWPIARGEFDPAFAKKDNFLKHRWQDIKGRYWDVVYMLRVAIDALVRRNATLPRAEGNTQLIFGVHVVQPGKRGAPLMRLKSVAGPADDGSPCLTIMLPEED